MKGVWNRSHCLILIMAVPLIAMGLPTAATAAPENQLAAAREECAHSPTVTCVMTLAIETAETIDDADGRANAFVRVAEAQRTAGDEGGAQESLSRALAASATIDSPSITRAWPSTSLCGEPDPFSYPYAFWEHREAPYLQARIYIDVAMEQARSGNQSEARTTLYRALTIAESIEDHYSRADVLCSAAAAVHEIAGGQDKTWAGYSRALAAADKIEDDRARAAMLADIADAQVSAGALQDATETMLKVRAIYARLDDAGDADFSSDLWRLAGTQARAGDFEGAVVTAALIGNETSLKRAIALSDVAHAQAAAGDVAGAFATEELVDGTYLRMVVVKDAGLALAAAGNIDGAANAAARITEIEKQEIWDPVYIEADISRSAIFQAVVEAHIANGALDKALDALEKIERSYQYVDSAIAVTKAQIAAGALDAARMTADQVCQTRHRNDRCAEALADLALAHAEGGNTQQAQALVSMAWKKAEWMLFPPERIRAFTSLWEAQLGMGDVEGGRKAYAEALTAALDIDYVPDRVDALTALGRATALMGEHDSAEDAFSAATAAAVEIEESRRAEDILRQQARAFADAGAARALAGDVPGAREAFSRALTNAALVTDDGHWRVLLFRDIASALTSARKGARQSGNDS